MKTPVFCYRACGQCSPPFWIDTKTSKNCGTVTHLRPPHVAWWSRLLEVPLVAGSRKNPKKLWFHPHVFNFFHLIPSRPTNMATWKNPYVLYILVEKKPWIYPWSGWWMCTSHVGFQVWWKVLEMPSRAANNTTFSGTSTGVFGFQRSKNVGSWNPIEFSETLKVGFMVI